MRLISIHQIPQLSSLWAAVTPHTSQLVLLLGIPKIANISFKARRHNQWKTDLLSLPIITAGAKTVQKDGIDMHPYCDCCPNYLCTELGGSEAVHTHLQILDDTDRNSWRCADEPKCNGQFLTMVTLMKHFLEMLL
jgi:hypothetical protein